MDAQRMGLQPEHGAVHGLHFAVHGQADRPFGDLAGILEQRPVRGARHEGTVREVGPVSERLVDPCWPRIGSPGS